MQVLIEILHALLPCHSLRLHDRLSRINLCSLASEIHNVWYVAESGANLSSDAEAVGAMIVSCSRLSARRFTRDVPAPEPHEASSFAAR